MQQTAEIFRQHRPGTTPVGIATAVSRDGETIVLSDLDHFLDEEITMQSIVIVGNGYLEAHERVVRDAPGLPPVILLLGGTSETAAIARGLAEVGFDVLVSTATDIPLDTGSHPRIHRRAGMLDGTAMTALVGETGAKGIVDATHPYAVEVRRTARCVAAQCAIPYLTLIRPAEIACGADAVFAENHEDAAEKAFSYACPVLVTTGARHLEPYAHASRRTGLSVVVRVLPEETSLAACDRAGIDRAFVIAARGPFSVEENAACIRRYGIGVVVTKDSGKAGGTAEKIAAARQEGCRIVVVGRPKTPADHAFGSIDDLLQAVSKCIQRS